MALRRASSSAGRATPRSARARRFTMAMNPSGASGSRAFSRQKTRARISSAASAPAPSRSVLTSGLHIRHHQLAGLHVDVLAAERALAVEAGREALKLPLHL